MIVKSIIAECDGNVNPAFLMVNFTGVDGAVGGMVSGVNANASLSAEIDRALMPFGPIAKRTMLYEGQTAGATAVQGNVVVVMPICANVTE